MPQPLAEINKGDLSIKVYKKDAITKKKRRELPRIPGNYVMRNKLKNYVGKSIDSLWRARNHIKTNNYDTAAIIQLHGSAIDNDFLVHIEFGLILIHLGCDCKLSTKQTDLPSGSNETRQRALNFFEVFLVHFHSIAPLLLGSRSRKNRQALNVTLHYLRMIWADR